MEKIGAQAYRLGLPESWKIHDVFHISLLKKWKSADYRIENDKVEEEHDIQETKKDTIERGLRWRKAGRGQPHAYLKLWEGHPPEEATWEPANRFNNEELQVLLQRDNPPEDLG